MNPHDQLALLVVQEGKQKAKAKEAAAKAAAALAALNAKAPPKKVKDAAPPAEVPTEADATTAEEKIEASAAETDATDEPMQDAAVLNQPPSAAFEVPPQLVSEEEAAARLAAKDASKHVEAAYDAKLAEKAAGESVGTIRKLIDAGKAGGLTAGMFDTLLAAADVKY